MRQVHCYCYYCGEEYEDEDELFKKCEKHLRGRKREESASVSSDPWAVSLDTKIKARMNSPDDPEGYTGKRLIEQYPFFYPLFFCDKFTLNFLPPFEKKYFQG